MDELRKNHSKYLFALFKIDGTKVVPAQQYPETPEETKAIRTSDDAFAKAFKDTVWPAFVQAIEAADGPRFAVIDFAFNHPDGRVVRVLTSIGWCADKGQRGHPLLPRPSPCAMLCRLTLRVLLCSALLCC